MLPIIHCAFCHLSKWWSQPELSIGTIFANTDLCRSQHMLLVCLKNCVIPFSSVLWHWRKRNYTVLCLHSSVLWHCLWTPGSAFSLLRSCCINPKGSVLGTWPVVVVHCVSKKVHPFGFHNNCVRCWPILIICGRNVAGYICSRLLYFFHSRVKHMHKCYAQ